MMRFIETRETAYGVDLDYVLDFIEYCNKGKAAMGCWLAMAEKWIEKYGAPISPEDITQAAVKFVREQGTRTTRSQADTISKTLDYPYADGRLSADKVNLPNGFYDGLRAAGTIKLNNGIEIKTLWSIRCTWKYPMKIKIRVKDGIVYEAD